MTDAFDRGRVFSCQTTKASSRAAFTKEIEGNCHLSKGFLRCLKVGMDSRMDGWTMHSLLAFLGVDSQIVASILCS
jgi:hypothetical protein